MPTDWSYPGRELESMAFALNYHRWIRDIFRPYLGKRIVEVGAGSGSFTELLLETKPEWLLAIEPSSNMFPILAAHLKHLSAAPAMLARQGTLSENIEAAHSAGAPDSVVYVNVLEHVKDDLTELSVMHALVRPGGHALIFVPANPWLMGSIDRQLGHYRRYTRQELRRKCEAAGFSVRFDLYFDLAGIVPWWIKYCLLKSGTMDPASVRLYDRWVVPWSRRIESRVRPPIGKNLLLVAVKP